MYEGQPQHLFSVKSLIFATKCSGSKQLSNLAYAQQGCAQVRAMLEVTSCPGYIPTCTTAPKASQCFSDCTIDLILKYTTAAE